MVGQLINPDNYSFTYHAAGVTASGIGILCFGILMLWRERSRVGLRNLLFSLTESAWLLSFGMAYASRSDALAARWFVIGYFGFLFFPAALVSVNASILQRERELSRWVWICYGLSAAFLGALLGTDLFVRGLYEYSWGRYPAYGPIGLLFICYAVVVGIASFVLFFRAYRNSTHPRFRARNRGFLISALIGYPAFIDFLPKLGFAVYPVGYLAVGAYILYASRIILKYRLVDITPEVATRQILDTMQGAVIVEDLEGKIRVVNRTALKMLGSAKEELLGTDLVTVLPCGAELRSTIRSGEHAASQETVWIGRDGERYDVNLSASSLTDHRDGMPVGIIYVAHDITKRKQAEDRLRKYSDELREVNKKLAALDRLKSDFVSTVSHELRTPLTSIKANVEIMLIKPALREDKKQRLLTTINDESDRLTRLINDLLDLSRIEAGLGHWRRDAVAIDTVLRTALEAIHPLINKQGIVLKTEIERSLPTIVGDRDRLIQVMNNLLSNAVKFTPRDGVITVTAQQNGQQVVISVADTGAGIPAQDLEAIFDKFHRSSDQVMSQAEGTGLGLTIARQIVEHHGGSIRAQSRYGAGTTMTVTMPVSSS